MATTSATTGLGEKDLFHDASAKLPMIVVDPRAAADATPRQRTATRWSAPST